MRKRILGSLAVVAAGAGLSFGQGPPPGMMMPGGPGMGGPGGPGMMMPGGPGMGGPGMMMPGGPGMGGPGGLMLSNGQPIIPPPLPEGTLNQSMFGPPGSEGGPEGPGGGGRGVWEQGGPSNFWFGFDYLMMWQKSQPLDAVLVTTNNGQNVLGNKSIDLGKGSGLRQWFGFFLDEEKRTGVEFSWFLMESRGKGAEFNSTGSGIPYYAVPFIDATTNTGKSYVISAPGTNTGSIQFGTQSQTYGIEGNMITNLYRADEGSGNGIDFLCGMRFFSLEERMSLDTRTSRLDGLNSSFAGVSFPGATLQTSDRVRTFNEFYGANFGLRGEHSYGRLFFGWNTKIAVGYLNSYADATGASSVTSGGAVNSLSGGRFIEATDIGRHRDGGFAFLPEGGVNLGYQVSQKIRFHVGYNFMYINRVIRPGNLFDQRVNSPTLATDPNFGAAPVRTFAHDMTRNSDYYLQGINFGLQIGF